MRRYSPPPSLPFFRAAYVWNLNPLHAHAKQTSTALPKRHEINIDRKEYKPLSATLLFSYTLYFPF